MGSSSPLPVDQAQTHRSERCTVHLWHPTPGVLVTRVEGHYVVEGAKFVDSLSRRYFKTDGRLLFLNDWWEVDDYDRQTRDVLVGLGREFASVTDASHILFRSKLVAFGVQAAAILLRNITTYTDRATFEDVLSTTIRRRAAHPHRT